MTIGTGSVTYGYAPGGELNSATYSADHNQVSYHYDGQLRCDWFADHQARYDFQYDDTDSLLEVKTTYLNTALQPLTTDYLYHPNGACQSKTTTVGGVTYPFTYRYDGAGRAISLTNPFGKTVTWRYRANGRLDRQILGNRAWTAYRYDAKGQLTGLVNRDPKGHLLSKFSDLQYDGAGKCKHLTAHVPGVPNLSGETTYTYKPGQSQLQQESSSRHGAFAYNFDYDTSGNPTIFRNVGQGAYTNNQIPGAGFVYDATTGNPTTYKGVALTYDQQNRLTSYGTALTAGYLTDGRRAWKESNGQRTYFIYDGNTLLAELNAQGQVTAVNTFGPTGLLARNEPLAHKETWYTFDTQGNVMQRLDATGQVLSSDLYDAWGKRLEGSDTTDPYGYKGQYGYYTDHETGLILCTHRYYDPDTGRWLTQDPIGYQGGMNLYGYCGNDPVNGVDPSGYISYKVIVDGIELAHGVSVGHHLIPWSLISNQVAGLRFRYAFSNFCNSLVSGPLDPAHAGGHGGYTKAIIEIMEDMKATYGDMSKWGAKEAQVLVTRTLESTDSRIVNILKKMPLGVLKGYAQKAGVTVAEYGVEAAQAVPEAAAIALPEGVATGIGAGAKALLGLLGGTMVFCVGLLAEGTPANASEAAMENYIVDTKYYYEKSTNILWQVDTNGFGNKIRTPIY